MPTVIRTKESDHLQTLTTDKELRSPRRGFGIRRLPVLAAALAAALAIACARTPARAAHAPATTHVRLSFAVVVSRHGVRSIGAPPKAYAWATWAPVERDFLTAHGYRLVTYVGAFERRYFASRGITLDCTRKRAYVYADTDQRTLETGRALIEGLCGSPTALPMYHQLDTSGASEDPLFNATAWMVAHGRTDFARSRDAVLRAAPTPPDAIVTQHADDFSSLQAMLDARCLDGTPCTSVIRGASAVRAHGGLAELGGPLATASSYAEDLFLEYAECRPQAQLGDTDPVEFVERLQAAMRLHVLAYDVNARNAYNPLVRGGTLFAHIAAMLEEKAGEAPASVALPPLAHDRIAIFSGHDTQLGALGGILHAHWHFGSGLVDDDMPPGSALVFELYRTPAGAYRVRLRIVYETLGQFRSATRVAGGVRVAPVRFAGCGGADCSVPLARIAALATALANAGFVDPAWTPDTDAPPELAPLTDPAWSRCGATSA